MKVLVYTARRWLVSSRRLFRMVGIDAVELTSPPLFTTTFPYTSLTDYDVVYFRLHGLPDQPYLYGASFLRRWGQTALSLADLKASGVSFQLSPLRVFFEGCYAVQTGIPQAFVELGAREVYAANTNTKNSPLRVGPAGRVGLAVMRAWMRNEDAGRALRVALSDEASTRMRFMAVHRDERLVT